MRCVIQNVIMTAIQIHASLRKFDLQQQESTLEGCFSYCTRLFFLIALSDFSEASHTPHFTGISFFIRYSSTVVLFPAVTSGMLFSLLFCHKYIRYNMTEHRNSEIPHVRSSLLLPFLCRLCFLRRSVNFFWIHLQCAA